MGEGAAQVDIPGRKDMAMQNFLYGLPSMKDQPEDDKEKARMAWGLLQKAKAWRGQWDKHWPRFWNLWEGNHYFGKIVHTLTRAVVNQIFSSMETFVGHVADSLEEPDCKARRPEFRKNAEKVTKWLKYSWQASNAETEIEHCIRGASVTGAGWAEIPWDETASSAKGNPLFVPRDEKYMYVAPYARNLREALYLIDASNVPREYVLKSFERGRDVPPGPWDGSLTNVRIYNDGPDSDAYAQFRTTDDSKTAWSGSSGGLGPKKSDLVTLLKCWLRQDDGSMRLLVVSNGVVLQDGPSPYDDEDFPYVLFNLLPTMDSPYGRSLVQFIEGLQELLDLSVAYLMDQQRYASDPMLIVDTENLEEAGLIDNMPGAVLPNVSQRGQGYYWMDAPGFNSQWAAIQQMLTDYMDSVLGRVDVLRGERPAGVNTLGGLEIIRDEANVRVRNLIRWVRASVKRAYILILSRLKQFAKDERQFRIEGKLGKEEFVTVNEIRGMDMGGNPVQEETIPDDAEFDVEFKQKDPGGEQAAREMAITLASTPAEDGLPMVDRQWVLEKFKIEETPEILERMAAMQEAQMQAEQAAQGVPQATQDPMDAVAQLFQGAG